MGSRSKGKVRFDVHYMLNGKHEVIPAPYVSFPFGTQKWLRGFARYTRWYFNINNRRVAHTHWGGKHHIYTTFIGMNLEPWKEVPTFFESLMDGDIVARYATWDEAVEGHRRLVSTYAN